MQNKYPKISVIVPVFNVENYLEKCLYSIVNQTYKNLEILIVNDGSTDNSLSIIESYKKKDKRIKVICQSNRGLSAARNTGLDQITGDYIGFVDSDDYLCLNMYEALIKSLSYSKANISCCNYHSEFEKSNYSCGVYSADEVLRLLINPNAINLNVWNKLFDSKLFKTLRFPEGKLFEDVYLMPKLIGKSKRICVIEDDLYHYRYRKSSISHAYTLDTWNNLFAAEQLTKNLAAKYGNEGKWFSRLYKYASQYKLFSCDKEKKLLYKQINKDIKESLKFNDDFALYLKSFFLMYCFGLYKNINKLLLNKK